MTTIGFTGSRWIAQDAEPELLRRLDALETVRMGRRAGIMAVDDVWMVPDLMRVKA